jgi:type VI secretion system protein ImpA
LGVIDVDKLLEPVSDDAPCGEDLEYDPAFIEMNQAAEERPEQQMGESVIAAEPADWKKVRKLAEELCGKTKDLRVGLTLTRALSQTAGPVGLADGLAFLRGLLEKHWDGVHPKLDPDDDNDPTMRVNILIGLVDPTAMLRPIRMTPIVASKTMGKFSLRDIEIARGELIPGSDEEPADMAVIDAAFMDSSLEDLQERADAMGRSVEHAKALDTVLTEKVGATQAPDLSALPEALGEVHQALAEQLSRRGVETDVGAEGATAGASAGAGAPGGAQPIAGEVNTREDVIRVLDKACHYYERHEPSSPVPLLLRRAKRLVAKDFMEILRDLAPEGVSEAEKISGSGDN